LEGAGHAGFALLVHATPDADAVVGAEAELERFALADEADAAAPDHRRAAGDANRTGEERTRPDEGGGGAVVRDRRQPGDDHEAARARDAALVDVDAEGLAVARDRGRARRLVRERLAAVVDAGHLVHRTAAARRSGDGDNHVAPFDVDGALGALLQPQ